MDTKPISNGCPKCQAPLPVDAPQGLCPKCLLAAVATPTEAGQPAGRPLPPALEEIAAAFPQLEILEFIGQGGMGFVFKARQPKLDRLVALKILPHSLAADPTFAERFNREARLLARLSHPGIVTVHDFGVAVAAGILPAVEPGILPGGMDVKSSGDLESSEVLASSSANPGGKMPPSTSGKMPDATSQTQDAKPQTQFYYLLMEFVDGVNLRQAMQAGRFTPDQALAIVPKICEALQFAHNEGILHRDIKPENILLDAKGRVKIADFGIAKLVGDVAQASQPAGSGGIPAASSEDTEQGCSVHPQAGKPAPHVLTEAGKTLGTPNYMAPEQLENAGEVDHRADIYSLGVVFYEMLTGELPRGQFPPPSQKSAADPRVDEVVLRALEKEKAKRPVSADEVRTQVETIAATPPGSSRREEAQTESGKPSESLVTSAATNQGARFSRTAIVGATWAALFFLMAIGPLHWHYVGQQGLQTLMFLPSLLGLAGVLGTTILGWVAVSQIRRSAGKLHGLWLAVFDGLLFPLLALDGLIVAAVGLSLMVAGLGWKRTSPPTVPLSYLLFVTLVLGILLLVDWLIIRRVWRAVKKDTADVAPAAAKMPSRWFYTPGTASPFTTSAAREIAAHMTAGERNQMTGLGKWVGIWNSATFFLPFVFIWFLPIPVPLNWILGSIALLGGLAVYSLLLKKLATQYCSTAWAREKGIRPETLRMFPLGSTGLMLLGVAWLIFVSAFWWQTYKPEGVWLPWLVESSLPAAGNGPTVRVTAVSQHGQIVLVRIVCDKIPNSGGVYPAYSGPMIELPYNLPAEVTNVDCLLTTAPHTYAGTILVGTNLISSKPVFQIGFVLPDEQAAAVAVKVVRKFNLGKTHGLDLPLFVLRRALGKDDKGNAINEEIFCMVSLRAKPVGKKTETASLIFGPVMERVVTPVEPNPDGFVYVNLEKNELMISPVSLKDEQAGGDPVPHSARFFQWIDASNANFAVYLRGTNVGLVPLGTRMFSRLRLRKNDDDFAQLTPLEVRSLVADPEVHSDFGAMDGPVLVFPELPASFVIKTWQGGMGLLQITGFTENPPGVKIRYKLVQDYSNTNTTNRPDDLISETNSQALPPTPPFFQLKPSTQGPYMAPYFAYGGNSCSAFGDSLKELIARVWSQKNPSLNIVYEASLPETKFDLIIAYEPNWPDKLQSEIDRRFSLVEQVENRMGKEVVVIKSAQTSAATSKLTFGTVVERVVNEAIDFDSGQIGPVPPDEAGKNGIDRVLANIKNFERAGWDFMQDPEVPGYICGVDLRAKPLAPTMWDSLSARQVVEELKAAPAQAFVEFSPLTNFPATYVIQTREGGRGILQITGFTEHPPGVKLRYKLVQEVSTNAP